MQTRLPESLGDRFTVAEAVRAGVPLTRLRKRDLERPFHGMRRRVLAVAPDATLLDRFGMPRGAAEQEHLERARDYARRMGPSEFFSHVTAAVLWDLPLPASLVAEREIEVGVLAPHRLPRSRGVRGHEAVPKQTTLRCEPRTGLILTSPATTWASLGSVIKHPYDLIAVGDTVVRSWRAEPLATVAQLEAAIAAGRRVGIGKLRDAVPRVRVRAASRPETRARLELVDAGLAEPQLNFDVVEDGEWFACVDLAYPEFRVSVEYEGEHHLLDPDQWARDIVRYERLAAAGWRVIRVTKAELFGAPHLFVLRVRGALADARPDQPPGTHPSDSAATFGVS